MKKARLFLCTGLLVFLIGLLSGCGAKTVNLNDYIEITVKGYDTLGEASYDFDQEAFREDFEDKLKLSSKNNKNIESYLELGASAVDYLLDFCVDMNLNKRSELSNGDTVILEWDCNEETLNSFFNYKVKFSNIEQKVSGLKKVDTFDPFAEMEYEFSGISPSVSLSIKQNYDKKEMQYIDFSADETCYLQNGDTVTIKASVQGGLDKYIEKFDCMPSPLTKEITVKDMPTYITSAEELSDEVITKCKELTNEEILKSVENWNEENKFLSADYLGYYFLTTKKENNFSGRDNYAYFLYNVNCIIDGEKTAYVYALGFCDLYKSNDNKIDLETLTYELPYSTVGFGDQYWVGWEYETVGYNNLDEFVQKKITSNISDYAYEKVME